MTRLTSSSRTKRRKNVCRLSISFPCFVLCFVVLLSSGYPAFASHNVSPSLGSTANQTQNILLQENFDDGNAEGFGNESGNWKIADGKYTATTGQFRFSTAGNLNWQDYVLEADCSNAQDGGLLVRAQDSNNCIAVVFRPTYNDMSWNIRKNGAWGPGLETIPLGYKPGANLHVKIEVAGSEFKSYINGELKNTLKTTEFPKGKIGLYLYSQTNQYWDNITVYTAEFSTPSITAGDIVGEWRWFSGTIVRFHEGGTFTEYQGNVATGRTGTWRVTGSMTYELKWSHGYTDSLTLSADLQRLDGKNQTGTAIWGTRISGSAPSTPTSSPGMTQGTTTMPPATANPPLPSGLTFESRSKTSRSTVQIPLTLKGAKEKIGNMDLTLTYDPVVLKANEALRGSLTSNSIFDFNITSAGTIKIALADKIGFEGDGSVAYVSFTAIGAAGAASPLKITGVIANSASDIASMKITTQDGIFKVLSNDILKGDFDGDGKLTALDALAALQMAVGKRVEDLVMDVTGDGKVTSADARKILQMAVSTGDTTKAAAGTTAADIPLVKLEMTGGNPTFNLPAETISKVAAPNQALTIESGTVKLVVPAGGVAKNTEIVIKKFTHAPPSIPSSARNASAPKARALGYVYDVGPNGLKFEKPVQLTMKYDDSALELGEDEKNIALAYYDGTDWVGVGGLVDTEKNTVSIMVTEFPGEPFIPVVLGPGFFITFAGAAVILIFSGFMAYAAFTEPYELGYANEYVTPFNETVQDFAGKIRVNGKPFYSPEELATIIELAGIKQVAYDVNGKLIIPPDVDPGKVWYMPEDWFARGMMMGDCNEHANAFCSVLRAKGFKAKCVWGTTKTGRIDGQTHVWVEFEVNGKMYYFDQDGCHIDLLSSQEKTLELQKKIMWDEMGQELYKDKWWEVPPPVPPPPAPGYTGRMVTAKGFFTGLEKLGYKPGYWSKNFIELRFNSAGGETIIGTGLLYHTETNLSGETMTDSISFNFTMGKYWRNNGTAHDAKVVIKKYHKDFQSDGWAPDKTVGYTFIKSGFEEVVSGDIIEGKLDDNEWPGPFRLVVK